MSGTTQKTPRWNIYSHLFNGFSQLMRNRARTIAIGGATLLMLQGSEDSQRRIALELSSIINRTPSSDAIHRHIVEICLQQQKTALEMERELEQLHASAMSLTGPTPPPPLLRITPFNF